MRTDEQIISQTNQIAREIYLIRGYEVAIDHKFYEFNRRNYHPMERESWDMACIAQVILTGTDPQDALDEMEG